MLFCQGSVFKTLYNLALLNAALLCVGFFLRVFLRMPEPQLVLIYGFSPNKAVRWKATPYDYRVFLNRGTYSLSNGNRTEMLLFYTPRSESVLFRVSSEDGSSRFFLSTFHFHEQFS